MSEMVIGCDCVDCRPAWIACRTCGVVVEWDDTFIRESRSWIGCCKCAEIGDSLVGLGPAIKRFLRRVDVMKLVRDAKWQTVRIVAAALNEGAMRRPDAEDKLVETLDKLAAMAMGDG